MQKVTFAKRIETDKRLSTVRSLGVAGCVLIALLAAFGIPSISSQFTELIYPSVSEYDPDDVFLWITIHHTIQFVLTVATMLILARGSLSVWGFNLSRLWLSFAWIVGFVVVYGTIEYMNVSGGFQSRDFPLTQRNMLGIQGFQYFLSGTGEEPLFRGLMIVLFSAAIYRISAFNSAHNVLVVIISTMIFMAAHLNIRVSPFAIDGFDFDQQTKALQLGVLYAVIFVQTRSLLAPIVIHGLSNGLLFTMIFYFQ